MNKRGLKLWSINTDYYFYDALRLYESGIFDYIELYAVANSLEHLQKWKIMKKNHNIPFIIHCPHFAHGFNLAKAEKSESNLKIYNEVKQFADELDAQFIIFHGGIDGNIEETAKQLASFNENRALIENKPYVALPNRMGGEYCRGYSTDEIKLVKDTANCGFCFDFGHAICAANSLFNIEKYNIATDLEKFNPKFAAIEAERIEYLYNYLKIFLPLKPDMYHLTDVKFIKSVYDSHPHLGTGELDFKRIFDMVDDNKCITFETNKNSN